MKQTNKWVSAVFGMVLSATATMAVCEQAEAAFGSTRASSNSVGVSRSYSRPSSPSSYSRPAAAPSAPSRYTPATRTYTPPSYTQPRSSGYDSSRQRQDYNRGGYGGGGGYQQPQNNSAMRQIGITAAGVGGGILAASAIQSLISSPSHPGMYTSPTNPGQYYNAQGVPQGAPSEQAAQEQRMQSEPMQPQYAPAQAPQVQYVQAAPVKKEEGGGFFGFLWGVVGFIVHLAIWIAVVSILGYGGYKLYKYLKAKYAQEKANSVFDLSAEQIDLEHNAQDVFYDFQANSDNKEWLTKRTKYIDIDEAMSPKSTVLSYEQSQVTVALEQGKLRGSVLYRATLKNAGGEESIHQWYNFEKDTGVWKVIGVEAA